MKRLKKIFAIFMLLNLIVLMNLNYAEASFLKNIEDQASAFINKGNTESASVSMDSTLTDNIVGIGQVLTFVGVGVLVCVTSYLGIQYLISPPDKQGAIKEKLIGLVFATIVVFGARGIWKIALDIFSKLD